VALAYRAYWSSIEFFGRTANWRSPLLKCWMTGAALRNVIQNYRSFEIKGWTLRGSVLLNPTVTSVSGHTARIRDCQDASRLLAYDSAGHPVSQGVSRFDRADVTLMNEEGQWKVSDLRVVRGGC
jgi:hypothetical protein